MNVLESVMAAGAESLENSQPLAVDDDQLLAEVLDALHALGADTHDDSDQISVRDNRRLIMRLCMRALACFEAVDNEPDPDRQDELIREGHECILRALKAAVHTTQMIRARDDPFAKPLHPADADLPRCRWRRRPRSSRGPPDDEEDEGPHDARWQGAPA